MIVSLSFAIFCAPMTMSEIKAELHAAQSFVYLAAEIWTLESTSWSNLKELLPEHDCSLTSSDSPEDQKRSFTELIVIEFRLISVSEQFHPYRGSLLIPVLVPHQSETLSWIVWSNIQRLAHQIIHKSCWRGFRTTTLKKKAGLYSAEVNSFAELIKAFTIVLDWIIIWKQVLIYNHTFWELSQIICLAQRMYLTAIHLKDIKWLKLATWLSLPPETVWNSRSLCCLHILSKRHRNDTFICQKWFLFY